MRADQNEYVDAVAAPRNPSDLIRSLREQLEELEKGQAHIEERADMLTRQMSEVRGMHVDAMEAMDLMEKRLAADQHAVPKRVDDVLHPSRMR